MSHFCPNVSILSQKLSYIAFVALLRWALYTSFHLRAYWKKVISTFRIFLRSVTFALNSFTISSRALLLFLVLRLLRFFWPVTDYKYRPMPEDYDIIFLVRKYYIRSSGLYSIHGAALEMGRFCYEM